MTAKKKTAAEATPKSFESALERLEQIVADMESGELSLEKMIADFEEGQKLVTFCQTRLNEVERKIEVLVSADGKTKPFDEDTAEHAQAAVDDDGDQDEDGEDDEDGPTTLF